MIKKISALLFAMLLLCSCADSPKPEPIISGDDLSGDTVQEDTDLTPIYDNTAIVEAYHSENTSKLDEKQLAIYNAAIEAVNGFYSAEMSEEDIVLAAHDWIVTHTKYDSNMLLPIPRQTEDAENPYGLLIKKQAICMGYTTTFQLFMDMLEIESIIVRGTGNDEEHAWNMVNIGGEWYHVDVTWDDFVPDEDGRPAFHIYFMVPDYAMETNHVWDHDSTPRATSEDKIYYKSHGLYAGTEAECVALLRAAKDAGLGYAEIMTPSNSEVVNYLYTYWPSQLGTSQNSYVITIYWIT